MFRRDSAVSLQRLSAHRRFERPNVEATVHHARKTGAALIIEQRRIERVRIEVWIARVNSRTILSQRMGPARLGRSRSTNGFATTLAFSRFVADLLSPSSLRLLPRMGWAGLISLCPHVRLWVKWCPESVVSDVGQASVCFGWNGWNLIDRLRTEIVSEHILSRQAELRLSFQIGVVAALLALAQTTPNCVHQ
jgi:hypothetical protein